MNRAGSRRVWIILGMAVLIATLFLAAGWNPGMAHDDEPGAEILSAAAFDQHLDAQAPGDLAFWDESGRQVHLDDYFGERPAILVLGYYDCPMLCTLVLNDLTRALKGLDFTAGRQFEVVVVSIDPGETSELAAQKKSTYLQAYGRAGAASGWHFLTGDQGTIDRLAGVVGFQYAYDPVQDQYAHPAGIMILTPQGRISRYIFGIDYTARDVRLGLVEASAGQIGSPVDQFLLLCYHYDPEHGRYSLLIDRVVKVAGSATALILIGGVLLLFRREGGKKLVQKEETRQR